MTMTSGAQTVLWVATNGQAGASGTIDDPFATISEALEHVVPGTVIKLAAGAYTESVKIDPSMSGTTDHPVVIEAADGPGTVTISGANTDMSTFEVAGASNITIRNLTIVGVGSTDDRDDAPIKLTTTQDGLVPENIVIEGNTITGTGRDAIKLATADDVTIINNTIDGTFGQEAIDLFSVQGATIVGNVIGGTAGYSAICAKAGTTDLKIEANLFNGDYEYTIKLGGQVGNNPDQPALVASLERNPDVLQADTVYILNNVMTAQAETDVKVLGATNVHIQGNYLGSTSIWGDSNTNIPSIVVNDIGLLTFRESFAGDVVVDGNVTTRAALLIDKTDAVVSDAHNTSIFGSDVVPSELDAAMARLHSVLDGYFGDADNAHLALAPYLDPVSEPTPPPDSMAGRIAEAIQNQNCGLRDADAARLAEHVSDYIGHQSGASDIDTLLASAQYGTTTHDAILSTDGALFFTEDIARRTEGSDGNDILIGAEGKEVLRGGNGDDFLFGGAGNDYLAGGRGNDTIVFGGGTDQAIGHGGADTFIYDSLSEKALVRDFTVGEDRLVIISDRYASIEDLFAHASEHNGDVRIGFSGGDFLILEDMTLTGLHDADISVMLIA